MAAMRVWRFLFVHFIMDGIVIALYEGKVCAFVRIVKFKNGLT